MKTLRLIGLALLAAVALNAQSKNLSVSLLVQEHSQWCWAGSSRMILVYKGKTPTQCAIANYSLGRADACGNTTFDWNSPANVSNSVGNIAGILNHWGVSANYAQGYPYWGTLTGYINNNKPFVILKTWTSGGGHFVVGKGYSGSSVYVNDPWPGNGSSLQTYSSLVSASDHTWTWTAYLN